MMGWLADVVQALRTNDSLTNVRAEREIREKSESTRRKIKKMRSSGGSLFDGMGTPYGRFDVDDD
jgi:hypothetical protein